MTNAGRVLLIPKGDYNALTTYTMLDVVYYEGRSYVCKQTSTGNLPTNTTYWQAMTEADADKMNTTNPTGTGSFSLNRKANTTIGSNSFAEGEATIASGEASHAEGQDTTASGNYSHAEGTTNVASGYGSHAEGLGVTASGVGCHAEGNYTIAGYQFQHVCGKNNDNKATTLFEVGNGADPESDRSNAFEVYSDGTLSTDNGTTKVKLETLVSQNQALTNYVVENNVKNLLPNNLVSQTITSNEANLTVAVNNGIVTLNGPTGTSSIILRICDIVYNSQIRLATLFGKRVKMSGCPSGGSSSTYYLTFYRNKSSESNDEFGNGATFDVENDGEAWVSVSIVLAAGQTLNNIIFKPMITLSDIPNSDYAHYQPYAKTNVELTQDVAVKTGSFAAETGINASKLVIKQCGHVVTFNGYLTGVTTQANTETSLGTYSGVSAPPSGEPVRCLGGVASAAYHSTSEVIYVSVGDDGKLLVRTPSAQTNKAVYFSCSYIV